MATLGDMPKFYGAYDDWFVYAERLEQFFEVNDIPDEKKKAILLISISEGDYKTLRDVCHPALPKEKTYNELFELLNKQFVKKTSILRERYNFYNARQKADESIANWFARIKKLSIDCKFGEQFDDILLDRFISGMKPSAVLDRLCEEEVDSLTLQGALEIATNRESVVKENSTEQAEEESSGSKRRGGRKGRGKRNDTAGDD